MKVQELKPVKIVGDDGDWYVVPNHLFNDLLAILSNIYALEQETDEWYLLINQLDKVYGKYRVEGDLNNQQFYIK